MLSTVSWNQIVVETVGKVLYFHKDFREHHKRLPAYRQCCGYQDLHNFWEPDPDQHPHKNVKAGSRSASWSNSGAVEAQNGAEKAQNGGSYWSIRGPEGRPVVAEPHHFDEEPDPHQSKNSYRVPLKVKSRILIRIKVVRVRNKVMRVRNTGNHIKMISYHRRKRMPFTPWWRPRLCSSWALPLDKNLPAPQLRKVAGIRSLTKAPFIVKI